METDFELRVHFCKQAHSQQNKKKTPHYYNNGDNPCRLLLELAIVEIYCICSSVKKFISTLRLFQS